jgi:hypothetical protein
MKIFRTLTGAALLLGSLVAGAAGAAEITLYERTNFGGGQISVRGLAPNITTHGFNDRASSLVVHSGRWQVCTDADFRGHCAELGPGEYATLDRAFDNRISSAREVGTYGPTGGERDARHGIVKFFAQPSFGGRSLDLQDDTADFRQRRYNDRAASLIVAEGVWEVCTDAGYAGECRRYGPGRYADLGHGMDGRISSARVVRGTGPVPVDMRGGRGHEHEAVGRRRDGADGVRLFAERHFGGESRRFDRDVWNLETHGFNDRARSMVVDTGRWEVCTDAEFGGRCREVGPGSYAQLRGMNGMLSSLRRVR